MMILISTLSKEPEEFFLTAFPTWADLSHLLCAQSAIATLWAPRWPSATD